MEIQKIKIKSDYKLADIIREIEKGVLRIPQFQREFVWDKPRVMKLLESIYLEYPIGSFFFWDAPRKYYDFYRDIAELNLPKPDKYEKITFILDGQQRLTSLYVTVKGLTLYNRNYKKICFDLDEKVFVDRNPDNQRYVSISDLLSNDRFDVYEGLTVERKKAFNECYQRFNNYPFSAIDVHDKELDEVCDIFERINQGGQKLNLFDLISASTWTPEFDLRVAVKKENEKLKTKEFGEIHNEVYIQALSLIAKGSCTRVVQLQLRVEDVKNYWKTCLESLGLAIDYACSNFGVVNSLLLPYRSLIAVIAYLFYKNKARSLDQKQVELLSQWFWQTTFSERYAASTLTLMTEDRKLMDKIADRKEVAIKYPLNPDIESLMKIRMTRKSAVKNGVLCLLVKKNPRHFKNNSLLPLRDAYFSDFNSSEKHHIFPKSIIQNHYPMVMVHSLPNFCFLPAELNKEISNKKPSKYFEDYASENPDFEDTLKTHLIRYDDSIKKGDFTSFLASRAALMLEEITVATGSKIGQVVVDDVNRAIDKTENQLRDLIGVKLIAKDVNYWKTLIPSDIVGVVRNRVGEHLKKNPPKVITDLSPRDWLDFCDIMDYSKIILLNWDTFQSIFRSKYEVEKRFLSLKEYRNAVKHGRGEIAPFIKKEGEAALEWLAAILKMISATGVKKSTAETDKEIIERVKSPFVKKMVRGIPNWTKETFVDGRVAVVKGGAGSDHYIKVNGKTAVWYYFAQNWVFAELKEVTPKEKKALKQGLTKEDSILERAYDGKVRFHLVNEGDFKTLEKIIQERAGR
ncbi:MAG TPA: DUF262 domain-containing protein [Candidatus Bathyarchaeia archaeon]|nr:DUF262 domain-containing protein [Candidatus Bathyarchaeia archaeon]